VAALRAEVHHYGVTLSGRCVGLCVEYMFKPASMGVAIPPEIAFHLKQLQSVRYRPVEVTDLSRKHDGVVGG
jgi:hypothetical protein